MGRVGAGGRGIGAMNGWGEVLGEGDLNLNKERASTTALLDTILSTGALMAKEEEEGAL